MMTLLREQFPADHFTLLSLVLGLPLLGALCNGLFGKRIGKQGVTLLALAAIGGSFLASLVAFALVATTPSAGEHEGPARLVWNVWRWFSVTGRGGFRAVPIDVAFSVDALSATMALVVTGVGFLIHVYSTGYMAKDPGYHRYFAYLNLFIFAMLVLILGDNMAVLFVGWEGVGLCSYLLIGFWFDDEAKARAGKKAFITNRIGDFGLLVAMAMLLYYAGTLNWGELQQGAPSLGATTQLWPIGRLEQSALPTFLVHWLTPAEPIRATVATLVCLAIFLGCMGKSAQIPLYVWLPDAMAGPTPVSALIHAATMVTAGVYLVARTSFLFALSPAAMTVVTAVGALTALLAACIALAQTDLKKVLAYSTVSQLGFMFIGVGVGAFGAGFFHVVTHAFFKGCLFLCAGSVIHAMHARLHSDEVAQDMRRMGGLRKYMPTTHWTFLVSCLAIAGCPPLAGFWSKDELLWKAFSTRVVGLGVAGAWQPPGWFGRAVFVVGLLAALGTAFYMFRAYFMTFWGDFRGWKVVAGPKHAKHAHLDAPSHAAQPSEADATGPKPHESPAVMTVPLVLLAVGAALAGLLYAEPIHLAPLGALLEPVFAGASGAVQGRGVEPMLGAVMAGGVAVFAVGAGLAAYVYRDGVGQALRSFADQLPGAETVWRRLRIDPLHVFVLGLVAMLAIVGSVVVLSDSPLWILPALLASLLVAWFFATAHKAVPVCERAVADTLDAMGDTAAAFDKWVVDGILARVTAFVIRVVGGGLRLLQTGHVQAYLAAMVVGAASIGWFLLAPHAEARADDAEMRRSGRVVFTAAPGLGYGYRWYADGEKPPKEFDAGASYTLDLDWCQERTVHLDVRNALRREASTEFRYCRSSPIILGCCVPGAPPPKLPTIPKVPQLPRLEPGRYDAGVLQELLSPSRQRAPAPDAGASPSPAGGAP